MRGVSIVAMFLFLLAACSVSAFAQSFNCRYAKLPAEVAICQSAELSALDSQMASLYFALPSGVRDRLEGSQMRWLRQRNACGYNFDCIASAYRERIDFLSEF